MKKPCTNKKNSTRHRQEHLQALAEEADLVGNDDVSYYIHRLIIIEQQVVVHKEIKQYTASVTHQSIKHLKISKDPTIGWDNIPKDLPFNQWRTVIDNREIEDCLIKRNIEYPNQVQGTPCTIPSLSTLLEDDSFTPFRNDILNGTANFENLQLTNIQKAFFYNLRKHSSTNSSKINNHNTVKKMSEGFKKGEKKTSTSPSLRHLGHYTCLLSSDNNTKESTIKYFNTTMPYIHNTMINAYLAIGTPLERWTTSEVIMIPKIN